MCQALSWALETEQGAAEASSDQLPDLSELISYSGRQLIRKWKNTQTGQGQMETTNRGHVRDVWERGGGYISLSGQGGPLGGGDPELRTNQEGTSR